MTGAGRLIAATALVLAVAAQGLCYSGVGRGAVERALGKLPQSEDELDAEIERLEREWKQGVVSAAYPLAVLRLNRPASVDLEAPRALLQQAILADPANDAALELWIDLLPSLEELTATINGLRERAATSAAAGWALAAAAARLETGGDEALAALDQVMKLDPSYAGRAHWLRAVLAAEKEDDATATRELLAALDALDEPTARLVARNALFIASPEEIKRFDSAFSEDRKDFFLTFWKRRDVFPLSDANERFGEHMRRLRQARAEYRLDSNGRGYLSMHDVFKDLSPDLPFYSSDVVYDYQALMPDWVDHRGLMLVRHGEPDRSTRSSQGVRAETWLYYRFTFKPLLFHFIDRRGVGEFVITLNLAQALTVTQIEDDPKQILANASDFRDLYSSRSHFHPLFQQIAISRSSYEIEDLLEQEAITLAAFAKEAWYDDTNTLIEKDDLLPFAAYSTNFRADGGKVDTFVYYAVAEKRLKIPGPVFDFDSTIVIFSSNWEKRVAQAEHHFRYERPAGKKPDDNDLLVGALGLPGLEPGRYNFAFQVTERNTGKVGIAKGKLIVDYYGPEFVNMSDLLIAQDVVPAEKASLFERNGHRIVPIPTRALVREQPAKIYFEVYDLKPGADGRNHYQVDYRVLQIQKEPSVAEKVLGISMNVAGAFFPYQVFLARAGLFGLGIVTSNPERGLDVVVEERSGPANELLSEILEIDTKKYPPGIYQAYITVKDHVSGSLSTRNVRFAIVD